MRAREKSLRLDETTFFHTEATSERGQAAEAAAHQN